MFSDKVRSFDMHDWKWISERVYSNCRYVHVQRITMIGFYPLSVHRSPMRINNNHRDLVTKSLHYPLITSSIYPSFFQSTTRSILYRVPNPRILNATHLPFANNPWYPSINIVDVERYSLYSQNFLSFGTKYYQQQFYDLVPIYENRTIMREMLIEE